MGTKSFVGPLHLLAGEIAAWVGKWYERVHYVSMEVLQRSIGYSFLGIVYVYYYSVAIESDCTAVEDIERFSAFEHRVEPRHHLFFVRARTEEPLEGSVWHKVARRLEPVLTFEHTGDFGLSFAHLVRRAQV